MKHLLIRSALFVILAVGAINLYAQSLPDTIVSYFRLVQSLPQEKLHLHLDKPYYAAGDTIWFKGYLQNAITHKRDAQSNFIIAELISRNDTIVRRQKIRRDSLGFAGYFPLSADLPAGDYYLRGYSNWMLNAGKEFFYYRNLKIGNSIDVGIGSSIECQQEDDYEVTFFPEGGNLLEAITRTVAFKAQGADGLSLAVTGAVLSSTGDTITHFATEHDGMGRFAFAPEAGTSYHAVTTSPAGVCKRFDLPEVKETGIALSLVQFRGEIRYTVAYTEKTTLPDELYLIAHTRGALRILKRLTPDLFSGILPADYFSEGITHFLLADGAGIPLSERLCFVRRADNAKWSITPDKESYTRREKVVMEISAVDNFGRPLSGDFSISVTDAGSVVSDSLSGNIRSDLLLTSDLKGHIENPGYYFLKRNRFADRHLDLVMLTHGWSRFAIDDLKALPDIRTEHYLEKSQSIGGRVRNKKKNNNEKDIVTAFAPGSLILAETEIDENGTFLMVDVSFPENTEFVVQSRKRKNSKQLVIEIDSVYYPLPSNRNLYKSVSPPIMDDYLWNVRNRYYSEGGIRTVDMQEVVVKGKREKQDVEKVFLNELSTTTITAEEIENTMSGLTIFDVLGRLPGVEVIDGLITIRGNSEEPAVLLDGFIYASTILNTFSMNDVKRIDVLKGVDALILVGDQGANGAILIELKRGENMRKIYDKPKGSICFTPLGYSKYREFYVPKYDTLASVRFKTTDFRTTLYWNPCLMFDKNGKAVVEFYNSDVAKGYLVEIEGVDEEGRVVFSNY